MIDSYWFGQVSRISPEAPVPVVDVRERDHRLGGAGNVALNILSMGATPIICSVVGRDQQSNLFFDLLRRSGISTSTIIRSSERCTTTKSRVVGNGVQMLRFDEENRQELSESEERQLLKTIRKTLQTQTVDAIIFQDYDKGVITRSLIEAVVLLAKSSRIPVCVDPKKRHFRDYKGVTLIKPNLKELSEGLEISIAGNHLPSLREAMRELRKKLEVDMVFTTLSEFGVAILDSERFSHYPAHVRQISDVSGAGDTVISVVALGLAIGLQNNPEALARISNLAGGLVCESVGVVSVDKKRLLEEIKKHSCL